MKISYRKLQDGTWGVGGPADVVVEGARIAVTKKDGRTRTETVGVVVWSDGDAAIATIVKPEAEAPGAPVSESEQRMVSVSEAAAEQRVSAKLTNALALMERAQAEIRQAMQLAHNLQRLKPRGDE